MTALVRSVHVLGICFRVNKKYVPLHVLRGIAEELSRQRLNVFEDYDVETGDSDELDSHSPGSPLELLRDDHSHDELGPNSVLAVLSDAVEMEERQEEYGTRRATFGERVEGLHEDVVTSRSVEMATFASLPLSGGGRDVESNVGVPIYAGERPFAEHSGNFGESVSMSAGVDLGGSGAFSATLVRGLAQPQGRHMLMNINRDDGATILAVRIGGVDSAYLFNYSVTARNHQVIMAFLLHCIRRHRGSIFYRTGDCLGAVWNAFDSCPNHAARAAACACDMAAAFAEHRKKGLQVGIVLHQGNFVFGNVDDSKEAFATAFGEAPQQAVTLADYAAPQSMLSVVVSEPVKQSLSSLYEFAVVDVIRLLGNSNHLILFDLCGRRPAQSTMPNAHTPGTPAHSTFAIEYTKAFSLFRDNRFDEAMRALQAMPPPTKSYEQRLMFRLEQLSRHFAGHPTTVPRPYCRQYPHWVNYEMIALAGVASFDTQPQSTSRLTDDLASPVKCISPTTSPYVLPLPTIDDVEAKIAEVDDALVFKRELHDNMRRLGTPSSGTPMASCATLPSSAPLRPQRASSPMSPITPIGPVQTLVPPLGGAFPSAVARGAHKSGSGDSSRSPVSPNAPNSSTHGPLSTPLHSSDFTAEVPPLLPVGERWTMEDESVVTPLVTAVDSPPLPALSGLGPSTVVDVSPTDSAPLPTSEVEARRATSLATALSGSIWQGDSLEEKSGDHSRDFAATLLGAGDSDSALAVQQSLIQSVSFTLDGTVQTLQASGSHTKETLPPEICAKNGNTYLRSGRLLGRGSFGSVYMGVDVNSGKLVAVKYLPMGAETSELENIEAEVMIMQRVKDSHVVEFISYAFQGDNIVLIMECMMAGSLQNMISAFHTLPSSTARVFIRDVLRGLNKLHSMGVVHRDVKPQNVLLTLSGSCKISDFGASASIQELARKDSVGRVCGTPVYLAPEAAQGKPVKKSDIWSCGIMFLQLLTGQLPYADDKLCLAPTLLVYQIGSYLARPIVPTNLDEMDALFARECLREAAADRPSAAQLLQMPLFAL